ncbi:MAG: hypothetical protein LAQ30_32820, partial [Acidobacteriia bacterium]|nr:hypothetical protein [Terriglobia bacterium]
NTLSASGSRAAHGSLYGFFGDRRLNARNFFDSEPRPGITALTRAGDGAPVLLNGAPLAQRNPVASETPFTRFETGAVVSTPLGKPDSPKTFAVAALDWQRTRAAEQSHFAVPAVDDRGYENTGGRGISPGTAGNATPLYPASLAGDAVFSLFPFPNNLSGPYGRKTYTAVLPADADAWMGSGKIDRYFHGKLDHSLALRYAASHEDSVLPSTGGGLYSAIKPSVRTRNLASFLNTNLTPQVVNSFRFSWGDSRFAFGTGPRKKSRVPSAS